MIDAFGEKIKVWMRSGDVVQLFFPFTESWLAVPEGDLESGRFLKKRRGLDIKNCFSFIFINDVKPKTRSHLFCGLSFY